MRKAFTLIELMIVTGIIAILAGLIAPQVGRAIETAKETTCRANLKNLHSAALYYANEHSRNELPRGGSYEYMDANDGLYKEAAGWISWVAKGGQDWRQEGWWNSDSSKADQMATTKDVTTNRLSIVYGSLYKYTGANINVFRCPLAAQALLPEIDPNRNSRSYVFVTYVMNPYCRWNRTDETTGWNDTLRFPVINLPVGVQEASSVMLFAERPTDSAGDYSVMWDGNNPTTSDAAGTRTTLGTYHRGGAKKTKLGLVIFLDGHSEKVPAKTGNNNTNVVWYLNRGRSPF